MTCQLATSKFECRVSSVLNKNVKSYGKQYMFDSCSETCWNSDAGTPQWITIKFDEEIIVSKFEIEFQGGFAGKDCHIEAGDSEKELTTVEPFYPEDKNGIQKFTLNKLCKAKVFKFMFEQSTDFFGRIIIYKLSMFS
ncbi:hypothetical protein KM043_004334 [Ampulex compressa]|nr:hypothetical protein KM043_004334 [Ampulex compressa]